MKQKFCLVGLVFMLLFGGRLFAEVTTTQYFYLVKQPFPQASEISIFITKKKLASEKEKIDRATVQFQKKAVIYEIENSVDIGKAIKSVNENSILVIYDDAVFKNNTNKLYLLSKCKEKKISLFTSSLDYIESGALLGFVEKDNKQTIILNITNYDHLKSQFNMEKIQQLGISEVIPPDYLTSAQ